MQLIEDIINELVESEKSITSALLKTKVLASRLQNKNLLMWVSNELQGYQEDDEIPYYRKSIGHITGTYTVGYTQYNNQPVPTSGLNVELEEAIRAVNFTQSVSTLESLVIDKKSDWLEYSFSAEIISVIQKNWQKMGNPFLHLINCKKSIAANSVVEILSVVRNKLLDFMLKIDSEFGNITEIEELKKKQTQITTIMNQTIINTSGDGNVVNTGNKANISATVKISKGNKEELIRHLQEIGITEADTQALVQIIDIEEPSAENKTFGKAVRTWTEKMLGKALDGSWNIGIGAAGTMLAEAIQKYYGL